jgi:hypothetical protein
LPSHHTGESIEEVQVTEGTLTGTPAPSQDDDSTGQPVEKRPATVEETEAFWRNRFSARDRAHNAETAALKAQIEAMQKAPAKPVEGESPEAARLRELEAELERERNARKVEALRAKYPTAISTLGDAAIGMDESKIAAIEAMATGAESSDRAVIDPNSAGRRPVSAPPKSDADKTKDDLLGELKALTPAYQQALREK